MYSASTDFDNSVPFPRATRIPLRPETETLVLLQGFIAPILKRAISWSNLSEQLARKGYAMVLRDGEGILFSQESKRDICTSSHLGMPLADLIKRLGAPSKSV